jgi:hypothetical protein
MGPGQQCADRRGRQATQLLELLFLQFEPGSGGRSELGDEPVGDLQRARQIKVEQLPVKALEPLRMLAR